MENGLITLDESQKALTAESIEYIDAVTRQAAALDREVKAIKTKLLGLMGAHGISKIETDTTLITLVVPETPKPREVFDMESFKRDNEFLYSCYVTTEQPDPKSPYIKITNR